MAKTTNNLSKFQKNLTVNVSKQLLKEAEKIKMNLSQVVEDKLLTCAKENILQSYSPRSVGAAQDILFNEQAKQAENEDKKQDLKVRNRRRKIPYKHTGTFLDSIYTEKKDNEIVVKIRDLQYENGKSTIDVYKWLTNGTSGGGNYYFVNNNGERPTAHNYPIPRHEFEEQTMVQMLGYLHSLENDIKNGKYSK